MKKIYIYIPEEKPVSFASPLEVGHIRYGEVLVVIVETRDG